MLNAFNSDMDVETEKRPYPEVLEEAYPGNEGEPLEVKLFIPTRNIVMPVHQLHDKPQDVKVGPILLAVLG